jgi:predicted alpha/beta hydrolase
MEDSERYVYWSGGWSGGHIVGIFPASPRKAASITPMGQGAGAAFLRVGYYRFLIYAKPRSLPVCT